MEVNEYQELAGRTINHNLSREEMLRHALFEMCGELGEIHSIYQKVYQGHQIKTEELKKRGRRFTVGCCRVLYGKRLVDGGNLPDEY